MAITFEKIGGIKNKFGEGPAWDVAERVLYWIDGDVPAIYRPDPNGGSIFSLDAALNCTRIGPRYLSVSTDIVTLSVPYRMTKPTPNHGSHVYGTATGGDHHATTLDDMPVDSARSFADQESTIRHFHRTLDMYLYVKAGRNRGAPS